MKKYAILTLMLVISIMMLSSCGQKKQIAADEDGNILCYTVSEIPEPGFYVHDIKADTFSPVLSGFTGYEGLPNTGDGTNFEEAIRKSEDEVRSIWISDTYINPLKLVPTVDNRTTELVLFQEDQDEMPGNYVLEKFKKLGYTIGVGVTFGQTGSSLYLDTKSFCEDSNAEEVLKKMESQDGLLEISRINKSKNLPKKNVDPEVNRLLGLEKDKKYQIGFFDGTNYEDVDVLADSLAFKSQQVIELASPYKTTEDNYFVINLPKNLKSGYYYINDAGMFGFKAKDPNPKYAEEPTSKASEENKEQ